MSLFERNNTSFPLKIVSKLKLLYDEYKANPDINNYLKYYQYLPQFVLKHIKSRGLLVYASPGMGKTRIATSVAATYDNVIVLEPQGLHNNFRGEIAKWKALTGQDVKVKFVSSNAYNTGDQFEKHNINNSLIVIDEAHIFFKSIINSPEQTNARRIYDMIMAAKNVKILLLTGTPVSKNPFELVPCFNLLAGYDLLPTNYETFARLYISDGHMINKEKFQNRIFGLVSHVDSTKPSDFQHNEKHLARDEGYYPEDLGITVERVEMSEPQYQQYLLFRYKEDAENKRDALKRNNVVKALALPGSSKKSAKTYYVRSRMCSNFVPQTALMQDLPSSVFLKENGPKLHLIAERIANQEGKSIAYSQFVENGLNPLGRYLELLGYELYDVDNGNISIDNTVDEIDADVVDGGIEDALNDVDDLAKNTRANSKIVVDGSIDDLNDDLKKAPAPTPVPIMDHRKNTNLKITDVNSPLTKTQVKYDINRQDAIKKIKFAKHLCSYCPYIDNIYNEKEREIIKSVVSTDQKLIRWYNENDKIKLHYRPGKGKRITTTLHHGQRKLFLSELQLFTETLKSLDEEKIVLYAGSAPGVHIPYLASLFPKLKFILWDPAPYTPNCNKLFEIHNDFFTDEVAESYLDKVDYFISDIRIGAEIPKGEAWSQAFEDQVGVDMEAQMRWTQLIKPRIASLLKFRLPYIDAGTKLLVPYLHGRVMLQTWPSMASTETRLLTTKEESDNYTKITNFDVAHYQDWLFYHNFIIRTWATFGLGLDDRTFNVQGFDRCFDCANEFTSWTDYIEKFKTEGGVSGFMNTLTKHIFQHLISKKSLHGYQSNLPMCEKRERLYDVFDRTLKSSIVRGGNEVSVKTPKRGHYAIISGGVRKEIQAEIIKTFNSPENINGEIIKCILMSEVGSTGLDLKEVRATHQIEPYWESTRMVQFRFRALRLGSHDRLPREKRDVKSYIYLSVPNAQIYDQMLEKETKTIDEQFYEDSMFQGKINKEFMDSLADVSLECNLFNYGNCCMCAATDQELFNDDPSTDIKLVNNCQPLITTKAEVKKIIINGEDYYRKENPDSPAGFDLYQLNPEFGGYVLIDYFEDVYEPGTPSV